MIYLVNATSQNLNCQLCESYNQHGTILPTQLYFININTGQPVHVYTQECIGGRFTQSSMTDAVHHSHMSNISVATVPQYSFENCPGNLCRLKKTPDYRHLTSMTHLLNQLLLPGEDGKSSVVDQMTCIGVQHQKPRKQDKGLSALSVINHLNQYHGVSFQGGAITAEEAMQDKFYFEIQDRIFKIIWK